MVETASEISTDVDSASRGHGDNAKTASEMSTSVDTCHSLQYYQLKL